MDRTKPLTREARLKAALRDNLRRRKAQSAGRSDERGAAALPEDDDVPGGVSRPGDTRRP